MVEQRIAELKSAGPAHLPSGDSMANAARRALAVIAHNLGRAIGRLAVPELTDATAGTLRPEVSAGKWAAAARGVEGRGRRGCRSVGCRSGLGAAGASRGKGGPERYPVATPQGPSGGRCGCIVSAQGSGAAALSNQPEVTWSSRGLNCQTGVAWREVAL